MAYRLVYCDEITDETHEIATVVREDGHSEVSIRRRSWWERLMRRVGLANPY